MEFEWDEVKSRANFRKHGLDFRDAVLVFQGQVLIREDIRKDYQERRWITMGKLEDVTVVIVHTYRGSRIRIISMRKANARERKAYERENLF
jgi:uncharacterized DUF497 family protein